LPIQCGVLCLLISSTMGRGLGRLRTLLVTLPLASAVRLRAAPPRMPQLVMQEPPLPLPYEVPPLEKPFADYEWDDSFPGTFKPGTRGENYDFDTVLEMWDGKDNPACTELPQDQLWQVPLAPPEDILSWLSRIGLLEEEETREEEEVTARGDSLLDDEYDLEEGAGIDGLETSLSDTIEM